MDRKTHFRFPVFDFRRFSGSDYRLPENRDPVPISDFRFLTINKSFPPAIKRSETFPLAKTGKLFTIPLEVSLGYVPVSKVGLA